MEKRASVFKKNEKARRNGTGFVTLVIIPVFLAALMLGTAAVGSISYGIHVLSYRNQMEEAFSALEDDNLLWQESAVSSWKDVDPSGYEPVETTRNIGPYVLLVKELKNRNTGQVLVNRLEFIPIGKTDEREL